MIDVCNADVLISKLSTELFSSFVTLRYKKYIFMKYVTPGPSKLEKVVDPGSGPQGPLTEIGVHYLNLDFQRSPPVIKLSFPS